MIVSSAFLILFFAIALVPACLFLSLDENVYSEIYILWGLSKNENMGGDF